MGIVRRRERALVLEHVEVPVSVVAASNLADEYLPDMELIADSELKKMGKAGKEELARRQKQRAAHVKAGRAFYVRFAEGYQGRSIIIVTRSKDKDRDKDGRLVGLSVESPTEGVQCAQMMLDHEDAGGVIYVEPMWSKKAQVIDVRPNPCEALAKTGKHDWFYPGTGDDVCSSCGLVI